MGTAGLARSIVNGQSRLPSPPARTTASTWGAGPRRENRDEGPIMRVFLGPPTWPSRVYDFAHETTRLPGHGADPVRLQVQGEAGLDHRRRDHDRAAPGRDATGGHGRSLCAPDRGDGKIPGQWL